MVKSFIIHIMKMKMWTMKEKELLKKHYKQVSMDELLTLLPGRTETAVRQKDGTTRQVHTYMKAQSTKTLEDYLETKGPAKLKAKVRNELVLRSKSAKSNS